MMTKSPQMMMRDLPSRIAPLLEQISSPVATLARATSALRKDAHGHQPDEHLPPLQPRLAIPMAEKTADQTAYQRHFDQAQFLARQENWAELGELIRHFDSTRARTPGGLPVAEVMALGARHDAVSAALEAIEINDPDAARAPLDALDEVLSEHCEDHGVALVIAQAHIDVGWAWRGEGWRRDIPKERRAAFHGHFSAAARIIDRFDAFELDAPSLAAARCSLLAAETNPANRVADDYEDLIDLDPHSPRHMRAMGNHLLPRWFGSYEMLDLQARRTAERTQDIWGDGAYTWVYFDALAVDPDAFDTLDVDLFLQGMQDILERCSGQNMVNLFAAYTGMTMGSWCEPGTAQAQVADRFDWIARDLLREIHPMVWLSLPECAGQVQCNDPAKRTEKAGRVRALSTLTRHFAPEIKAGYRIAYDQSGLSIFPIA
ncbi:hypothetical protein [Pseudoprimorskyibacter insulae]|nr:hypothetical protein [Pseudoprimorskyibacter insulae]